MKFRKSFFVLSFGLASWASCSHAAVLDACDFLHEPQEMVYTKNIWRSLLDPILDHKMTTSMSVLVNKKVVYHWQAETNDKPYDLMSVTKSIIALAIAASAPQETTEWLDESISDLLPADSFSSKRKITLRNILEQTTCLAPRDVLEVSRAYDQTAFALDADLVCVPGEKFRYNNSASNLALAFLEKKLGQRAEEAVQTNLFGPLGIAPGPWYADGRGVPQTMAGLHLSHGDLIRIASMILDHGVFEGRRVISKAWMTALFTPSARNPGYGLMWWLGFPQGAGSEHEEIGPHVVWAQGAGGQLLFLFPEHKVAVIHQRDVKETEPPGIGVEVALALIRASVEGINKM